MVMVVIVIVGGIGGLIVVMGLVGVWRGLIVVVFFGRVIGGVCFGGVRGCCICLIFVRRGGDNYGRMGSRIES